MVLLPPPDRAENSAARASQRGSGNRCGHRPDAPQLAIQPPTHHRARPRILLRLTKRLERWYRDPSCLAFAPLQRGRKRQRRSERREAIVALCSAVLHYTDLVTLRVGVVDPITRQYTAIDLAYLADLAGLSLSRAQRAMDDLRASGLIRSFRRAERRDSSNGTQWRGRAAVRTLAAGLFALFGLADDLVHARKQASQRAQKAATEARLRQMEAASRAALAPLLGLDRPRRRPPPAAPPDAAPAAGTPPETVAGEALALMRDLLCGRKR